MSIGGSKNIGRFLDHYGPHGLNVGLAGLCDAAEEGDFRRGLERAGFGTDLTRTEMEAVGFFVCVEDLEDELIRALGIVAVERVVESQGELDAFRTFQRQPEWRGRTDEERFRRFFGTQSGRKVRSASALVQALDLARTPGPLDALLSHI